MKSRRVRPPYMPRSRHANVLLACTLLLVAATATSMPAPGPATVFRFELTPWQVVGAQSAPSGATGMVTLNIEPRIRTLGRVTLSGIDATRVTLHAGHAGQNGPVVAEFTRDDDAWLLHETVVFEQLPYSDGAGDGYYVQVDSDAGALRGQVIDRGWHLAVTRLTQGGLVPQLPINGHAVAGFALEPDDGQFYLRLTTSNVPRAMRARLRVMMHGRDPRTVVELTPSAHIAGVWGSGEINDDCHAARLSADDLRAYHDGRLFIQLDTFGGLQQVMQARLLPPPQSDPAFAITQQRGTDR